MEEHIFYTNLNPSQTKNKQLRRKLTQTTKHNWKMMQTNIPEKYLFPCMVIEGIIFIRFAGWKILENFPIQFQNWFFFKKKGAIFFRFFEKQAIFQPKATEHISSNIKHQNWRHLTLIFIMVVYNQLARRSTNLLLLPSTPISRGPSNSIHRVDSTSIKSTSATSQLKPAEFW